jgi:hypothetical protein
LGAREPKIVYILYLERSEKFKMKVYFEKSFWSSRRSGCIGLPQKVDWEFTYEGQQYQIPMIYRFPEGITLDIISLLDTVKIKNFQEEYKDRIDNISEEERLCIEAVHPIQEFPLKTIYINNELVEMGSGCSACFIAGADSEQEGAVLREIQKEYDFLQGEDISFKCMRVHMRFLNEAQKEIHMLKFITSKTEVLLPIKRHFRIGVGMQEKQEEEFVHPLNRIKYHVYINEVKEYNARKQFPQFESNRPFHYAGVSYELDPLLPHGERLLLREIEQKEEAVIAHEDKSVIGYCQGVSAFGKSEVELGKHGYPLETIFTNMYWKSLKDFEISIVGIYKEKCAELEIMVYNSAEIKK